MKFALIFSLLCFNALSFAQEKLAGHVRNPDGEFLVGANVYIKGTYCGVTTDTAGYFSFSPGATDTSVLVVSYMGYSPSETFLKEIPEKKSIEIVLKLNPQKLDAISIIAGAFEAGEKSRAVLLSPIEIASIASSDGDVYGALKSFPGTQKQGETGKLIVRGGAAGESKTFIDGMLVSSPYTSSLPDLPARGRFSPFMFNGIMFSTGGYSAEYGQALSSVLELKTPAMFNENLTSFSIMNVGAGLSHTHKGQKSSYSAELNYSNLYPYFLTAQHELEWIKVPQSYSANFFHRHKTRGAGIIKTDITCSRSSSVLRYNNSVNNFTSIGLNSDNVYGKSTYNVDLGDKWLLKAGIAYNLNTDKKQPGNINISQKLATTHTRLGLVNYTNDRLTFKFGLGLYSTKADLTYTSIAYDMKVKLNAKDFLISGFAEADFRITENTALRIGGRGEYLAIAKKPNSSPRISLAQKVTGNSQLSLAWGTYFQQADTAYLLIKPDLGFEKATHFIVNYQLQKHNRTFRAEVYYKAYNNLLMYKTDTLGRYLDLQNKGDGFARGIDMFWKDDKTIKYATYWISYSYIDTKRKYRDYNMSVTPEYVAKHNLSAVFKYWVQPLSTQVCLTYNFSSGRPYNNPNHEAFMAGRTPASHDISANLSYITNIFGNYTIIHLSVSNIAGFKNIYTYRFEPVRDENGLYIGHPVSSLLQRTIIAGLFISIK
ncbi:MAG: carboxypeptidase-like regulatory domain-containing protein [Bacteroidales bacterium]|nr:carboxypeptidase-like regulatory domain-containing protein [Bacteroidales bacterium]